jgi:hypothetical protein
MLLSISILQLRKLFLNSLKKLLHELRLDLTGLLAGVRLDFADAVVSLRDHLVIQIKHDQVALLLLLLHCVDGLLVFEQALALKVVQQCFGVVQVAVAHVELHGILVVFLALVIELLFIQGFQVRNDPVGQLLLLLSSTRKEMVPEWRLGCQRIVNVC